MPENPISELTPEEKLRADNELQALNLELTYGAHTHLSDDAPPEVISAWLQNVAAFEAQRQDAPLIKVYDRIGRPAFAGPELLETNTFHLEIARLQEILHANGFVVPQPGYVDDAQFYQFLVTELFDHEVPDQDVPGMVNVIDYEEFHPNQAALITDNAGEFLYALLNLDAPYVGTWLSENLRDDRNCLSKTTVLARIQQFRERYNAIEVLACEPQEVLNSEHGTHLMFGICWEGQPVDGRPREHYEGLGVIQLGFEEGAWLVQGIRMPGFKF